MTFCRSCGCLTSGDYCGACAVNKGIMQAMEHHRCPHCLKEGGFVDTVLKLDDLKSYRQYRCPNDETITWEEPYVLLDKWFEDRKGIMQSPSPLCHFCKKPMYETGMGIGHPACELRAAQEARWEYLAIHGEAR